jgi:hypothetical protein
MTTLRTKIDDDDDDGTEQRRASPPPPREIIDDDDVDTTTTVDDDDRLDDTCMVANATHFVFLFEKNSLDFRRRRWTHRPPSNTTQTSSFLPALLLLWRNVCCAYLTSWYWKLLVRLVMAGRTTTLLPMSLAEWTTTTALTPVDFDPV